MSRVLLIAALVAAGCGGPAADPRVDTGARDAARGFFEAVVKQDWATGFAALHPDGRKGVSEADFARRGASYRRKLGFEPAMVRVPVCEERGDAATARVELSGPGGAKHSYKDAVMLKRDGAGWRVVLPTKFGLH